jgi:NAD(P)-dependent dehydrogenase (short-subunit alcohol dehydrogenase family)
MNLDLKGKGLLPKKSVKGEHVFITGGGSGIGRKMSMVLASQGAKVTIVDINMDGAKETVKRIKAENGEAACFKCDVTSVEGKYPTHDNFIRL